MRILYLVPSYPSRHSSGSSQRSALLHQALLRHGFVDVAILREGSEDRIESHESGEAKLIAQWRPRMGVVTPLLADPAVSRAVAERFDPRAYDLVVARYLVSAIKANIPASVPMIVDVDDAQVRYSSERSAAAFLRQLPWRLRGAVLNMVARAQMQRDAFFLFASERDRRAFPHLNGLILPNIPWSVPPEPPAPGIEPIMLFVGLMRYGPNARGVDRFVRTVWPRIYRWQPRARLRLVGAMHPSQERRWSGTPGVEAVGFVSDVAAEYAACAFTVCPVYEGGGSNIKVLESLAYGRTCVTTGFVHEGFGRAFDEDGGVIVGRSDSEVTEHCTRLLADAFERGSRAVKGRHAVDTRFSRALFFAQVAKAVRSAVGIDRGTSPS